MKFDVILVLAGGITNQGTLPDIVSERVKLASKFFNKKYAPRILMSGRWSSYWDYIPPKKTESQLMYEYALFLRIPKKALYIEEYSQNTFENIFFSKKIFLEPYNWKKILVITSDFHVKRVKKTLIDMLGSKYQIKVVGTITKTHILKKLVLQIKELILLHTQWFFQNFSNSRQ